MRVKAETQELYFCFQNLEDEVVCLMNKLSEKEPLYEELKSLKSRIYNILKDIKEYEPHNDLNTYFSNIYGYYNINEMALEINNRFELIKEKLEEGQK